MIGKEDRGGKNEKGKVVDDRAAHKIDQYNDHHYEDSVHVEADDPVRGYLGNVRDGNEMTQYSGGGDQHENHARGTERFLHGFYKAAEF